MSIPLPSMTAASSSGDIGGGGNTIGSFNVPAFSNNQTMYIALAVAGVVAFVLLTKKKR